MRSRYEIDSYVRKNILRFYDRSNSPTALAGSPFGVHVSLRTLHDVWAYCNECEVALFEAYYEQRDLCECRVWTFGDTFLERHPNASRTEVAVYEVDQWEATSRKVGIVSNATEPKDDPSE